MNNIQSNTKAQILEASSQLFMKHGIRSVSMDDLARHLGMSKKTIYQYFENKDSLVSAMILNHCEQEKREVESILVNSDNALDQMQMIARMALRTLDEVSSGTMFDLQKYYRAQWIAITDLHKKLIHSVIKQNIEQGITEGIYRVDIDANIIARLYGEMAFSVINMEVFPLKEYSMQEVYKQAFHYHINAILSSKGKKMIKKLNTTAE